MRYVHLPGAAVDVALLEDATRRGALALGDGSEGVRKADCCCCGHLEAASQASKPR